MEKTSPRRSEPAATNTSTSSEEADRLFRPFGHPVIQRARQRLAGKALKYALIGASAAVLDYVWYKNYGMSSQLDPQSFMARTWAFEHLLGTLATGAAYKNFVPEIKTISKKIFRKQKVPKVPFSDRLHRGIQPFARSWWGDFVLGVSKPMVFGVTAAYYAVNAFNNPTFQAIMKPVNDLFMKIPNMNPSIITPQDQTIWVLGTGLGTAMLIKKGIKWAKSDKTIIT